MIKKNKLPREVFRRNAALQLVAALDQGGSRNAVLDPCQGTIVPTGMEFRGGEDDIARLGQPVAELLAKEGGNLGELRFHNSDFWVEFITEAERELHSFTKR